MPERPAVVHVWIPQGTAEEHLALLPGGVELHELPRGGSLPDHLGPGHFVVADPMRGNFGEVLRRLDDVRVVQAMSAGVDDLVGQIPDGAVLCDGAGVHDAPVSEWVVMAILAMQRRLPQLVTSQSLGRWRHPGVEGITDLEGLRVLVVGYGSIGRAVEARLLPFGATIDRVARQPRPGVSGVADLANLLPQSDVVVILLPLTPETTGLVDAKFISQMRRGALLVNPARGRIVDTDALIDAARAGRIRAALDVTDPEPLPDDHPLWKMDQVLITPHVAGSVERVYDRGWALVADQLRRFLAGQPLRNVVSDGY